MGLYGCRNVARRGGGTPPYTNDTVGNIHLYAKRGEPWVRPFTHLTKSIQRLALRLLRGLGRLGCGGSGGLTARGGDLLMEGYGFAR